MMPFAKKLAQELTLFYCMGILSGKNTCQTFLIDFFFQLQIVFLILPILNQLPPILVFIFQHLFQFSLLDSFLLLGRFFYLLGRFLLLLGRLLLASKIYGLPLVQNPFLISFSKFPKLIASYFGGFLPTFNGFGQKYLFIVQVKIGYQFSMDQIGLVGSIRFDTIPIQFLFKPKYFILYVLRNIGQTYKYIYCRVNVFNGPMLMSSCYSCFNNLYLFICVFENNDRSSFAVIHFGFIYYPSFTYIFDGTC